MSSHDICVVEVAEKRHNWCVLRSWFNLWQERLERVRELAHFQQLVEEKGRRAVIRRTLTHWRHCII